MKKRCLSIGGRPGPLSHAVQPQFSRHVSIPGCDVAPRPIESLRSADVAPQVADYGLQQESQSKHPFLSRSAAQPYSSQGQRTLSLSQGRLTQSQDTQPFSQSSQPEDYSCDPWINRPGLVQDKEISLSQPKPPSPYFASLTSSISRRNASGNVGVVSTPPSSTGTSSALCLVGPPSSTPRPWPQCNVSEELEKRLCGLEKLREEETALLQKISDDYQQIKIFLEETCFEGKDNRSKLALQQNALHKLLKEEETANSSILIAIKTSGEAIQQDIKNAKQAAEEAQVANKNTVSASFNLMMESFREEVLNFKKDLQAELHELKQPVPITDTQPRFRDGPVPISNMDHDLLLQNQSSQPRMDFPESTPNNVQDQAALTISGIEIVDLDEIPDFDLETGFEFAPQDDTSPSCNLVHKKKRGRRSRKQPCRGCDESTYNREYIAKSVGEKTLRAQRRVRYDRMC